MKRHAHSKEADQWVEKKITGEFRTAAVGIKFIEKHNLCQAFKKEVGYSIPPKTLQYLFMTRRWKLYGKEKRKTQKLYNANFLLVVGEKVSGFDTFEEIKDFMMNNMVMLRDIVIFEKKKVNVDYNIKLTGVK